MRLSRRSCTPFVAVARVSAVAVLIAVSLLSAPMYHPAPVLADEDPPVFVELWGVENNEGTDPGQFDDPRGIAVGADGKVYVADTDNDRVQVLGSDGTPLSQWTGFNKPEGVAVDSAGNVYVADTSNRRIQKFDGDGVYLTQWGENGSANGQFLDPEGVTVDADGNVWVADTGNSRIQKFTADGEFIMTFGQQGSGDYRFSYPADLAATSGGTILVADTGNHCIKRYQPASFYDEPPVFLSAWGSSGTCGDGDLCNPISIVIGDDGYVFVGTANSDRVQKFDGSGGFIATWGTNGSGDEQVSDPNGIALDAEGTIYVADTMNHRIQVLTWNEAEEQYESEVLPDEDDPLYYPSGVALDATGGVLYVTDTSHSRVQQLDIDSGEWSTFAGTGVWGSDPGQFASPLGIAVDHATGWVYVVDGYNNRIQKFDSDGSLLDYWGSNGQYAGQFYSPKGVAVDSEGNVYVAEYGNCRIQKFDSDGGYLTQWGSGGSGNGQFNSPCGVAVHPNGSIYVADTGNNRVQVFGDADGFLTLETGWNMVSVPVQPDNPARGSVFPGAVVYEWNGSYYEEPAEIAPGVGYWVKVETGQTIPLFGTLVLLEDWECQVFAGWTMLAAPSEAITVSQLWDDTSGQPLVHNGVYE